MNNAETIKKIREQKRQITRLGHEYLKDMMPMPIGEFGKATRPFIIVEQAFDKAIKLLENDSTTKNRAEGRR